MTTSNTLKSILRKSILTLTIASAAFSSQSAQAGAFAVDSRNGDWTWAYATANVGDAATQYRVAVERAVYWGGNVNFIRCAQFNVPRGTRVECAVGYVPGKGWCGNWALNGASSLDGLRRQGAYAWSMRVVASWTE